MKCEWVAGAGSRASWVAAALLCGDRPPVQLPAPPSSRALCIAAVPFLCSHRCPTLSSQCILQQYPPSPRHTRKHMHTQTHTHTHVNTGTYTGTRRKTKTGIYLDTHRDTHKDANTHGHRRTGTQTLTRLQTHISTDTETQTYVLTCTFLIPVFVEFFPLTSFHCH